MRGLDCHWKAAHPALLWVFRSGIILSGRLRKKIFFLQRGHKAPPAAFPGGKRRGQLLQVASPQHCAQVQWGIFLLWYLPLRGRGVAPQTAQGGYAQVSHRVPGVANWLERIAPHCPQVLAALVGPLHVRQIPVRVISEYSRKLWLVTSFWQVRHWPNGAVGAGCAWAAVIHCKQRARRSSLRR